ncbi:MAG: class I SAM-dependent methyltransferase [Thermosynechococcaceae cyanobacterium]
MTAMTTELLKDTQFDPTKAEAFAGQMLNILNMGATCLMISIGHRTELFDTLSELPPSSSSQIADAAGLNERYVREWLNAMVVGRIVDYDPIAKTYTLSAEHAAFLTRAAGSDNIALVMQYIPILGSVEEQIVDCFYKGGGVPYSQYQRFHTVMAEDSGQSTVAGLFDHILPLIEGLTEILQQGIDVLDLGCGSGRALIRMAKTFPNSRFTGYDFSSEAIANAIADAQLHKLGNVQFQVKDAATLDECDRYDLITTFDAIHDQAKPDVVLHNIYKALRSDGVYLMQDIQAATEVSRNLEHPISPFLYTISCMHCMTVSLAYGGMGLGTMWGQEKALELLENAGFRQVEVKQLTHDFLNSYYIIHKF